MNITHVKDGLGKIVEWELEFSGQKASFDSRFTTIDYSNSPISIFPAQHILSVDYSFYKKRTDIEERKDYTFSRYHVVQDRHTGPQENEVIKELESQMEKIAFIPDEIGVLVKNTGYCLELQLQDKLFIMPKVEKISMTLDSWTNALKLLNVYKVEYNRIYHDYNYKKFERKNSDTCHSEIAYYGAQNREELGQKLFKMKKILCVIMGENLIN